MHRSRLSINQLHMLGRAMGAANGFGTTNLFSCNCSLLYEPGKRNFSLRKSQACKESGSGKVVQSWVDSVLDSTTTGKSADKPNNFLKRPEIIASNSKLHPNSVSSSESVAVKKGKHRRKTTDNMWTSELQDDKIIWVDCEMTGLNIENDQLMEIGIIITGPNLEEIARLEPIVFHIEEKLLQGMNEWCQKHHGGSGLTDSCRKSTISHASADDAIYAFVKKHTKPGECPIAGNSIRMDRVFITRQLPKLDSHLHYRSIDVSTIKELVRRWYPGVFGAAPKKRFSHRVMDDVEDSIAELKYYQSAVFIDTTSANAVVKNIRDSRNK